MNHVILDMDETLISIDESHKPISRPYLKEFLVFCFKNFKSVSIWTSANKEWFDIVNINVFVPILDQYKFRFVWCFEKCTPRKKISTNLLHTYIVYIKELIKVWEEYEDMTSLNTIIVDDNCYSFKNNIDNAIHIKAWKLIENDTELVTVLILLKKMIHSVDITKNKKILL